MLNCIQQVWHTVLREILYFVPSQILNLYKQRRHIFFHFQISTSHQLFNMPVRRKDDLLSFSLSLFLQSQLSVVIYFYIPLLIVLD